MLVMYVVDLQDPQGLIPRIEQLYNTLKTCLKRVPSAILHHDVTTIDLENDDDDDIVDTDAQASKHRQTLRDTYVSELKGQSFRMIKMNYDTHAFNPQIKATAGGGVRKDRSVTASRLHFTSTFGLLVLLPFIVITARWAASPHRGNRLTLEPDAYF